MKELFSPFLVILFAGSIFVNGQVAAQPKTAEELAIALSESYAARDLGSLAKLKVFNRSVRIVIEHSLSSDGDADQFEDATFRSFAQAEKWLKARGVDDMPARNTQPLVRCAKGTCTYDEPAMNHNSLFLTKFTYGMRSGRPYIKMIYLVDGD